MIIRHAPTFQCATDVTRATRADLLFSSFHSRLSQAERAAHHGGDNVLSTRERVRIEHAAPTDGVTNLGQPREPDVTSRRRLTRASQGKVHATPRLAVPAERSARLNDLRHVARDRSVSRRREVVCRARELDSRGANRSLRA